MGKSGNSRVDVELASVEEKLFRDSNNPVLFNLVEEGERPDPEYSKDRIFVGWNLGGKDEFNELVNLKKQQLQHQGVTRTRKLRNEAVQLALREFPDVVGNRLEQVYLDRGNADIAFYGGERGSGKSFNLRALTNQNHKAGVTSIIVDPEHEYYTNNQYSGIQNHLENLRKGETSETLDTKVLMPHFVYRARKDAELPQAGYNDMTVFKFEFSDLDPNDLQFVLTREFNDHPDFSQFVSTLERLISKGEMIRSWNDVYQVAERLQEEDEFEYNNRARQIKNFLKHNYEKWGFLGADKKINLKEILQEYDTVVLSLHDDERLPRNLYMKELYVKFLIKRVRNLVQRNVIPKPIDWVVDEAHRYIPAHTDPDHPPSKEQVRRVIKQDRKRGFRVSMASQEPSDVAGKNFLNQTTHFFIPQNMKPRPRKHLLQKAQVFESGDQGRDKWATIFRESMSKFQWLYVNSDTRYWCILEPVSPIAYHREE